MLCTLCSINLIWLLKNMPLVYFQNGKNKERTGTGQMDRQIFLGKYYFRWGIKTVPFWQYWDWFELHKALVNASLDRLVLFKGDTMGSNPKSRLFLANSRNLCRLRCWCRLLFLLKRCRFFESVLLVSCLKKPGNFLGHSKFLSLFAAFIRCNSIEDWVLIVWFLYPADTAPDVKVIRRYFRLWPCTVWQFVVKNVSFEAYFMVIKFDICMHIL